MDIQTAVQAAITITLKIAARAKEAYTKDKMKGAARELRRHALLLEGCLVPVSDRCAGSSKHLAHESHVTLLEDVREELEDAYEWLPELDSVGCCYLFLNPPHKAMEEVTQLLIKDLKTVRIIADELAKAGDEEMRNLSRDDRKRKTNLNANTEARVVQHPHAQRFWHQHFRGAVKAVNIVEKLVEEKILPKSKKADAMRELPSEIDAATWGALTRDGINGIWETAATADPFEALVMHLRSLASQQWGFKCSLAASTISNKGKVTEVASRHLEGVHAAAVEGGANVRIEVDSQRDGYAYLFNIDKNGSVPLIPNDHGSINGKDNHLKAGKARAWPTGDDEFDLEIQNSVGLEYFFVLVLEKKIKDSDLLKVGGFGPLDLQKWVDEQLEGKTSASVNWFEMHIV